MPEINIEQWIPLLTQYGMRILGVLAVIVAVWIAGGWCRRLVFRSMSRLDVDKTLTIFFSNASRWIILVLGLIGCLGVFGVETTSFAAVIGAAGLAIGLAFQGSLSNLAAGMMLLIFRPFKVGDFIRTGGESGTVSSLGMFTTELDTPDKRHIILPNSNVFGAVIENVTFHDTRRVDVNVGVDYAAEIDRTREVLVQAAASVPGKLDEPEFQVVLMDLGASSVDWIVRVWSPTSDYFAVREALIRAIKMHLDDAGIGIPFPQMDVHLDGGLTKP